MKLKDFLNEFGINEIPQAKLVGRSYFIIEDESLLSKNPAYIGECIAHLRGEGIIPSIDFLQKIGKTARKHVIVNPEAEWLFICGRDLFKEKISVHNNPEKGEKTAVLNQHGECIGYGTYNGGIKRLYDIGDLLRRERKKGKVRNL